VRTTEVRITDEDDFGGMLKNMRLWLDEHRFEPMSFTYFDLEPGMVIRVLFNVDGEAEAFAQRFGGLPLSLKPAGATRTPRPALEW
jgi:hypothetical protein